MIKAVKWLIQKKKKIQFLSKKLLQGMKLHKNEMSTVPAEGGGHIMTDWIGPGFNT